MPFRNGRQHRPTGHAGIFSWCRENSWSIVVVLVIASTALSGPVPTNSGSSVSSAPSIHHVNRRAEEINPVSMKIPTVPNQNTSWLPDFSPFANNSINNYDDETMSATSRMYLPGIFPARTHLTNGRFGATGESIGPMFGVEVNYTNTADDFSQPKSGWPLDSVWQGFSTVSGFFSNQQNTSRTNYEALKQYGSDSVIAGIPHPFGLILKTMDGQVLDFTVDNSTISNYSNTLAYGNGTVEWEYDWTPANSTVLYHVEYMAFASRTRSDVGVTELRVTPRFLEDTMHSQQLHTVQVMDLIDGRSAVRSFAGEIGMKSNTSIYVSNHPDGLPNVTGWVVTTMNVSNGYTDEFSRAVFAPDDGTNMSIAQQWTAHLVEDETAVFQKFITVTSSDHYDDPELQATTESSRAVTDGFGILLRDHIAAWNVDMNRSRIDSYRDPETGKLPESASIRMLQWAAVASNYAILSNLNLGDREGIAVGGLTSDAYGGMVFWDQDLWMFTKIALSHPHLAKQFIEFRIKQYEQAKRNAHALYVDRERYNFDNESVLYPWTAGRYGNATATGPAFDYEYHINFDVGIMCFHHRAITNDQKFYEEKCKPIVNSVAHTAVGLLKKDGDKWSIRNMTDPDEYANNVNNGAFTLAAISVILHKVNQYNKENGLHVNKTWEDMAANVNIPRAPSGIILEYEGMMNNVEVKQADVLLMSYPLDVKGYTLEDQRANADYYQGKQTPDGPGMTYAIHAIVENQIARSGVAAPILELKAIEPYARLPFLYFSEQSDDDKNANGGVSPAYPFLTGHGGALQSGPFGYLGLKLQRDELTCRPSLPQPHKYLGISDGYVHGNRLRISMNNTHTTFTRLPPTADVVGYVFDRYPNRPMPIHIERRDRAGDAIEVAQNLTIAMNETITVPNDMYWQQQTTLNNILQGLPTYSRNHEYYTAQNPGAATDGNNGTRWQPKNSSATQLQVDTSLVQPQRVLTMNFDWGPCPPRRARVAFTNSTLTDFNDAEYTINITDVSPNRIYGADLETPVNQIVPYLGNTTWVDLSEIVYTGKWAILEIEGAQDCWQSPRRAENGTIYYVPDERGATLGEWEVIGAVGTNVKDNLAQSTPDQRLEANNGDALREGDTLTPPPKVEKS